VVFVLTLLDKEELWMEREQKAREGVNSQTRERIRIPAQKVPAFSAGQGLKQAL
jgi:nucleoid DNA-binding protein